MVTPHSPLDPPPNAHIYQNNVVIKTTLEKMTAFHRDPAALPRLTPPPIFVRIHKDTRTSLTQGEIDFTLWFAFIPFHWIARHEPGPTPTSFADRMLQGPMAYWRHEHIFQEVPGGVMLTDRVTLAHHPGLRGLITRSSTATCVPASARANGFHPRFMLIG
jgi:ligand-binding SRPBCC domain-containing protein